MLTPDQDKGGATGTDTPPAADPNPTQGQGGADGQGGGTPSDGGGQAERPKWMDGLPDEHKQNEELYGYESIGDAVNSLIELKANSGGVKIPGKDASEEDIKAFRDALGVPEAPDGYEVARPTDLPKGMKYDETLEGEFLKVAHEHGMTPTAVNAALAFHNGMMGKLHEAEQTRLKDADAAAQKALKEAWPGDKYDENMNIAHSTYDAIVAKVPGLADEIDKDMLYTPGFHKLLVAMSGSVLEDGAHHGPAGGADGEEDEPKGLDGKPRPRYGDEIKK